LAGWASFWAPHAPNRGSGWTCRDRGLWSLGTFLALSFPWFFFVLSNPQVSQRLFILKDFAAMRRMILWVLGFGFLFTLIAVIWGFAALQLAPELENTSMATPALLTSGAIPVWVSLLLILGILSAAISTLDSIALTVGAMVARDFVRRERSPSDARQILAGRIMMVVVVLFASYFALQQAQIVDQLAALSAAGLLVTVPPIVGAFFWNRGTAAGALACMLGGGVVAVWMAIIQGVSVFNPLLPFTVAAVSVALFVGVSLITRSRAEALDFQARSHPTWRDTGPGRKGFGRADDRTVCAMARAMNRCRPKHPSCGAAAMPRPAQGDLRPALRRARSRVQVHRHRPDPTGTGLALTGPRRPVNRQLSGSAADWLPPCDARAPKARNGRLLRRPSAGLHSAVDIRPFAGSEPDGGWEKNPAADQQRLDEWAVQRTRYTTPATRSRRKRRSCLRLRQIRPAHATRALRTGCVPLASWCAAGAPVLRHSGEA
jgi:hypothetical protein